MKASPIALVAGLLAVFGATVASAAEVRHAVEIKLPPAKVWAKVGEWCAIKDWHPAIASCTSERPGYRTLTLKDGGRIVEKQTSRGRLTSSYSYEIIDSPLPVQNYTATLTARGAKGGTELVWTAKFEPKGKPEAEAVSVIKGIFTGGLDNVVKLMKAEEAAAVTAAKAAEDKKAQDKAARDAERQKAAAERQKKIDEVRAAAAERYAAAKLAAAEQYAKAKAFAAEKAKQAADAAKAAYEKAKSMVTGTPGTAPEAAKPKAQ
jgi:hypothetical protein